MELPRPSLVVLLAGLLASGCGAGDPTTAGTAPPAGTPIRYHPALRRL